ncbi:MAG: N-acetylneuraminate synthase [Phycisphaerales bacterium]|nr:MAG: N-acetylneuraminate synthase [Phycisphaerales bacterium]
MKIAGREIGPDAPPYVIAELGVNHDGSLDRALELVDAAAEAGADAVKVQVFRAEALMGRAARLAAYQRASGEADPVQMLRRLEMPAERLRLIAEHAHRRRLHAIATIFSVELMDEAQALGFDAYKSASPDIVHRPLLEAMAGAGSPLIVSTGAATLDEVLRACAWLRGAAESSRLALLQCVSAYPAPDEDAALGAINTLAMETRLPVGYSDHTAGVDTGGLAVAAGACLLEKHLTHDRRAKGPDHAASLEPEEFERYVRLAHRAQRMMGGTEKRVREAERDVREASRQSIVAARALAPGVAIGAADIAYKRPGVGLEPWRVGDVLGRTLVRFVDEGAPITPEDIA